MVFCERGEAGLGEPVGGPRLAPIAGAGGQGEQGVGRLLGGPGLAGERGEELERTVLEGQALRGAAEGFQGRQAIARLGEKLRPRDQRGGALFPRDAGVCGPRSEELRPARRSEL